MSDNNHNDAESLFATRRKQQQDADAQKAAQLAESEKFAELQRKKREMEEEISRLQSVKDKQEEQASYSPAPSYSAPASNSGSSSAKGSFDIKKYKPFILIGAGVLALTIIIIVCVAVFSKSDKKNNTEKKGGTSAMSDPGYEEYDIDDYEEGEYTDFMRKVDNYDWNSITDPASGLYFEYPAFLEAYTDESLSGYNFTYSKEENGYSMIVSFILNPLAEEIEKFDPQDFYDTMIMQSEEIGYDADSSVTGDTGDGIYYYASSGNGLAYENELAITLMGIKDDMAITAAIYMFRLSDGPETDIGLSDMEYMFRRIKNSLSFG